MKRAFCILLAACSSSSSSPTTSSGGTHFTDEYALSEISGSYGAFSDGQSLQIFVAYLKDGFLRVRPGGNDAITLSVNGTTVPTKEVIEDGAVHYVATVPPPLPYPVVTVTFGRDAEKVRLENKLGPAFELVSPPAKITAGDTVAIDVTPRPDLTAYQTVLGPALTHSLEVTGPCVDGNYQKIPLTGQESYPLSWDTKTLKLTAAAGCDLEVKVRMDTAASALEPLGPQKQSLKGAGFEAAQSRKLAATLVR